MSDKKNMTRSYGFFNKFNSYDSNDPNNEFLHKVHNEDCLDTMSKLPDNFIDLVVTSPPYDNYRSYKGNMDFDFDNIAKNLYRVIKDGGVIVWIVNDQKKDSDQSGTSFRQALYFKELGFKLFDTMIYAKSPRPACGNVNTYWQAFEYMFILSKGNPKTINLIRDRENKSKGHTKNGMRKKRMFDGSLKKTKFVAHEKYGRRTNVWKYNVGRSSHSKDSIAYKHPAIFPEKLAHDHIITWSNEGDIVYDPFMGSGTVAKMCILNSRRWLGSEINKEYCDICMARIGSF